jgi:hypothetical protein
VANVRAIRSSASLRSSSLNGSYSVAQIQAKSIALDTTDINIMDQCEC